MKLLKIASKRGLALFMALMMCLTLLPAQAMAAEEHEHGDECTFVEDSRELICEQNEHEHGEDCYEQAEPQLICGMDEHEHTEACSTVDPETGDVIPCEVTEHQHTEDCYQQAEPALVCEIEEHEHTEDCYEVTGHWVCPEPEGPSEALQAFLDAVNAIEVPEEDLVLEENAALAEAFSAELFAAYGLFEELTEEEQELEEVQIAMMELENMLTVLPEYAASTYALSNVVVAPDYNPGQCYPGVSRFGASIAKTVGENGFYKRRAWKDFYCSTCGLYFGRSDAKEYANIQWEQSVDGVISDVSFVRGDLQGYPCLQMNFTGAKAGTTLVTIQYDVNFHTRWNSGVGTCPYGHGNYVQQYDDNWYHYEDTFYVTVTDENAQPTIDNEHWVFVPANATDDDVASFVITVTDNEGYPFEVAELIGNGEPVIFDPNNVNNEYANVTATGVDTEWGYAYGIRIDVKGLKATPKDGQGGYTAIPVYVKYYLARGYNGYGNVTSWWTNYDKINIIVYDVDTVNLTAEDHYGYGGPLTDKFVEFEVQEAVHSTDTSIVTATPSSKPATDVGYINDGYTVTPTATEGSAFVKAKYNYADEVHYVNSSYWYSSFTQYVDVTKYVVGEGGEENPTTTPVTVIKQFDGLAEDQIPSNFSLSYTISDCGMCGEKTGTLNRANATLTNANGTPQLMWSVELPVVAHGNYTHLITFTESNATVEGYNAPTFTGNSVTLESLTLPEDAPAGAKPVITVTNRYEPNKSMYVLSYDGMGGTGCPATQYTNIGNTTEHSFNVAGAETTIKVPTNEGYTFKGWSETDTNQTLTYAYDSTKGTYAPDKITLTKEAPSKTLYAVWEKNAPTPPNPSLEKLEKVRVTDKTQAPAGTPDNVEYGTVIFRSDNQKVTLLYKITVTGTEGAAYKVTDPGAVWVSGGTNHETDASGNLVVTGTIAEDETTAVIYVTKEFGASAIANGKLTNSASLESNDPVDPSKPEEGGTEGPGTGDGKDHASDPGTDASEKRNVTINFKTDDGTTLQDSVSKDYDKGGEFEGISVNKPTTRAASSETIVIPWTIQKDGKTYVLDEVASKDALDALNALETVTENVTKDIIYSLDMKGPGTDGAPTDTPDGIPDKYQKEATFVVTGGTWSDGSTEKKLFITLRDNNGQLSTSGSYTLQEKDIPTLGGPDTDNGYADHGWWHLSGKIDTPVGAKLGLANGFTVRYHYLPAITATVTIDNRTVSSTGREQNGYGQTITATFRAAGLYSSVTGTDEHTKLSNADVASHVNNAGDVLTVTWTPATGTAPGTYHGKSEVKVMRGNTDVTNLYNITVTGGDLTITAAVTVVPNNEDGGKWSETGKGIEPEVLTPDDEGKVKLPEAEDVIPPAGKELDKWVDETGKEYEPGAEITPDGNLTLKPKWKSVYTVTFCANGGAWTSDGDEALDVSGDLDLSHIHKVFTVVPNATIDPQEVPDPVLSGFTFEGWYQENGKTKFDFNTPINKNIELHAHWKSNVTYKDALTVSKDHTFALDKKAHLGDPVMYQVTVTNATAGAWDRLYIEDSMPDGLEMQGTYAVMIINKDGTRNEDLEADLQFEEDNGDLYWWLDSEDLPQGATVVLGYWTKVTVDQDGKLTNTVEATKYKDESANTLVGLLSFGSTVTRRPDKDENADSSSDSADLPTETACQHTNTTTETKEATCTEDGSTKVTCSDCGKVISETTIPHTGHNYVSTDTPATCTTDGQTGGQRCSKCGDERPGTLVPHTGHAYGDWTDNGTEHTRVCANDPSHMEREAHIYGGWTITRQPTETEAGEQQRTCTVCGHLDTEVIPATGTGTGGNGGDDGDDNQGGTTDPGTTDPGTTIPDDPTPTTPAPTPVIPAPAEDNGEDIGDENPPLAGVPGLNSTDHFAYIVGYTDGTVRPEANISRAEVATIFFRLMTDDYRSANWATSSGFSDVTAGAWYNNAVSTSVKAGLVKGYTNGTFAPEANITRAEFATIAARFLGDDVTGDNVGDFADTVGHWAARDIRRAAEAGWLTGEGNKFRPDDPITRAEVVIVINRMLNRAPDAEHLLDDMTRWSDNPVGTWYYADIQEATNSHVYDRSGATVSEIWTAIEAIRDWTALEAEWAANGGASAK